MLKSDVLAMSRRSAVARTQRRLRPGNCKRPGEVEGTPRWSLSGRQHRAKAIEHRLWQSPHLGLIHAAENYRGSVLPGGDAACGSCAATGDDIILRLYRR